MFEFLELNDVQPLYMNVFEMFIVIFDPVIDNFVF